MADEDDSRKRMERFFFLVGYAITRWAYIDRSFFDFCKFCLNTTEHKTAIIFHRTPNIGDHLGLTNALMHTTEMKAEHLKHWELIVRAVEKLLPFRNEIAHNPPAQVAHLDVVIDPKEPTKPGRIISTKQWWEIRTEPTKLLNRKKRQTIQAKDEQLEDHIKKITLVERAIHALDWELRGRPPGIGPAAPAPEFPADLNQL